MEEPEDANEEKRGRGISFPAFMVFAFLGAAVLMVFRDCMA